MNLKEIQKKVYQNKVNHNFNVTNVEMEFCLLYGELSEAYEAYLKSKDDLGEELADIAIYLLGISEILGIDLEKEIENKMKKNEKRVYKKVNGVSIRVKEAD